MLEDGRLQFVAVIRNITRAPVCVMANSLLAIHPVKAEKDGVALTVRKEHGGPPLDGVPRQGPGLVTLDPGQMVRFQFPGIASFSFEKDGSVRMRFFRGQGPGRYTVTFEYRYEGPETAFHGPTLSQPVSFELK
jgi:hypothetical protein